MFLGFVGSKELRNLTPSPETLIKPQAKNDKP